MFLHHLMEKFSKAVKCVLIFPRVVVEVVSLQVVALQEAATEVTRDVARKVADTKAREAVKGAEEAQVTVTRNLTAQAEVAIAIAVKTVVAINYQA